MRHTFCNRLTHKLIDWLIAFFVSCFVLWFVVTQPLFPDSIGGTNKQAVNSQKLKEHVFLLTHGYSPRSIGYDNLNHTVKYIYRQFSSIGTPEYQNINTVSQQYRNVVLHLGPDTQEVYVVGAHFDAKDDSIDSKGNQVNAKVN